MSRKILIWTLPLILVLLSWSSDRSNNNPNIADELYMTNQLIKLVNNHRQSIGKPLLIRNATADKLAEKHANYMISKKNVNNDNFEERWDTLEEKVNAEEISENVGFDISAEKAISACMSRIWQKANVEGDFTHTGIAVKKDANGKYFYTQIFYR